MTRSARRPRLNPNNVSHDDFEDVSSKRAEAKVNSVRNGEQLRQDHCYFPQDRKWQDVLWAVLFSVTAAAVLANACTYAVRLSSSPTESSGTMRDSPTAVREPSNATRASSIATTESSDAAGLPATPSGLAPAMQDTPARMLLTTSAIGPGASVTLCVTAVVGGVLALMTSVAFVKLAYTHTNTVVHVALMLGPVSMVASGTYMVMAGLAGGPFGACLVVMGLLSLAFGVCMAFMILCMWGKLVPFTIRVTKVLAGVAQEYPSMMCVAVVGSIVGVTWVLTCFVAIYGGILAHQAALKQTTQHQQGVMYFGVIFVFCWGLQVSWNIPIVSYAGVFGRWYFGQDDADPVMPSLRAALTTSFGSVCEGSFMVAFIQTCEYVARQIMREAQEEGNFVVCIIMCIVTMVLDCIGDILEYFNEWTYVQCAIRGVNFLQAARITYSLCTCANIHLIWQDLLVNYVVLLGSLVCGVAGLLGGAVVGSLVDGGLGLGAGAITGLFAGFAAGSATMAIFSSGTKTILTCWAEDPERLKGMHNTPGALALCDEFETGVVYE